MSFIVAKVGGSLFDMPELSNRLANWLARQTDRVLFVPGGGPNVEAIRLLDEEQQLGEERSHWLALGAMAVNADFLAGQVTNSVVVESLDGVNAAWIHGRTPILDCLAFCRADDALPDRLPHTWSTTSDSIAARVAVVWQASQLVLLKSTDPPASTEDWADHDFVDPYFYSIIFENAIEVSAINLRKF